MINADCLDVLPIEADAVITDPPYGIGFASPKSRAENNGLKFAITEAMANRNAGETIIGDDKPFDPAPWLEYPIVLMWGANNYARSLPDGGWLMWGKMGLKGARAGR